MLQSGSFCPGALRPLQGVSFKESGRGQYFPICYFYRLVRIHRRIHLLLRSGSSGVFSAFRLPLLPLCFHVLRRPPSDPTSRCAYPVPRREPNVKIWLERVATVSGFNLTYRLQWTWMTPPDTCASYARHRDLHCRPTPHGALNQEPCAASPNPQRGSGWRSTVVNARRAPIGSAQNLLTESALLLPKPFSAWIVALSRSTSPP